MSTPGKRVPDLVLDRYLAGDLAPRARAELERELGASAELRARLDELRAERDAFLAEDPPERFAHRVAAKVATERRARPRILLWLAPASAAAVGVLAVAFALRHGDDRPGQPAAWREERAPSAQAEPAPGGEPAAAPLAPAPAAEDSAPALRVPVARRGAAPQAKAEADRRVPRDTGATVEHERRATSVEPPAARREEPAGGRQTLMAPRRDRVAEPLAGSGSPAPSSPGVRPFAAPGQGSAASAADEGRAARAERSVAPSAPSTALPPEPSPPSASAVADSAVPSAPPSAGAASPPLAAASRPESVVPPPSRRSGAALREAPAKPPALTIATRGALDAARVTPVLRAALPRLVAARRAAGVATRPLTVTCEVDPLGKVAAARVLSPTLTEEAARPILDVLGGLRFPAASRAGSTTIDLTVPAGP